MHNAYWLKIKSKHGHNPDYRMPWFFLKLETWSGTKIVGLDLARVQYTRLFNMTTVTWPWLHEADRYNNWSGFEDFVNATLPPTEGLSGSFIPLSNGRKLTKSEWNVSRNIKKKHFRHILYISTLSEPKNQKSNLRFIVALNDFYKFAWVSWI